MITHAFLTKPFFTDILLIRVHTTPIFNLKWCKGTLLWLMRKRNSRLAWSSRMM